MADPKMRPMVAAQTNTIREYMQTLDHFATSMHKLREIGYTAVQLDTKHITPDVPSTPADIKRRVDAAGLRICNTHIPLGEIVTDLSAVIAKHELWECQHVAIPLPPPALREKPTEAGYRAFAAEAVQIGRRLAEAGLTFSYHNHSFELVRFGKQSALDILFNESDPHYLQAEIDTYWIQHGGGDPAAWIRRMRNRMPVVHLKDMEILADGSQAFAEVGEGNLNWPAILAACRHAGVSWYVVEQDICRGDPFESLRISYINLQTMFQSDSSHA